MSLYLAISCTQKPTSKGLNSSNPEALPDLQPIASFVTRGRGVVCVVLSIVLLSNRRPRLERYRVSHGNKIKHGRRKTKSENIKLAHST